MIMQKYSDNIIQAVWQKGNTVARYNPDKYREDQCNAWISRDEYGNRKSILGWEVDHINPNGSDILSNLRPLQWENNVVTSDGKLTCPIRSNGNNNERV